MVKKMAQNTVRGVEKSLQKLNEWLNEIEKELGLRGRQEAYDVLRSVLHTLRDRLPPAEVSDFAAELPLVIKGIYYDGWNPAKNPQKMDRFEFLRKVHSHFRYSIGVDPEKMVHAVFKTIHHHIPNGEMKDVKGALPKNLAQLIEA